MAMAISYLFLCTWLVINAGTEEVILNEWINYPRINNSNFDGGWQVSNDTLYTTKNIHWTGFYNGERMEAVDGEFDLMIRLKNAHADPYGWTFRLREDYPNNFSFYAVEIGPSHNELSLAKITSWIPNVSDPVHGGPVYHGTINSADGHYSDHGGGDRLSNALNHCYGEVLATAPTNMTDYTQWSSMKIVNKGSNIKVYWNGSLAIDYTDPNPLPKGSYGPYTASQYEAEFKQIIIDGVSLSNTPAKLIVNEPSDATECVRGMDLKISGSVMDQDNEPVDVLYEFKKGSRVVKSGKLNPTLISNTASWCPFSSSIPVTIDPGNYDLLITVLEHTPTAEARTVSKTIALKVNVNPLEYAYNTMVNFVPPTHLTDGRVFILNINYAVTQNAFNDSYLDLIREYLEESNSMVYYIGASGTTETYIKEKLTDYYIK